MRLLGFRVGSGPEFGLLSVPLGQVVEIRPVSVKLNKSVCPCLLRGVSIGSQQARR